MRYLLLIYTPEPTTPPAPETMQAQSEAYAKFTTDIRTRGVMQAGEALEPTTTATTVRVRDGRTITTDGPFAETKEALGGFYLIEARDLDEAIEVAAGIPGAAYGSIEVRPIWERPDGAMVATAAGAAGAAQR
ncbi:MAG: YciI family protein [Chloroflexota bacterium]